MRNSSRGVDDGGLGAGGRREEGFLKNETPEARYKAMQEVHKSKMKESRCMSCGMDMDKLFLQETDGTWLCSPCSLKRTKEDSGQWKLYANLSFPIHAACAAGNLNAVTELWEGGQGGIFLFDVRRFPRDINLAAKLEESEEGWPPLAFACMPSQHNWPPPYLASEAMVEEEEAELSVGRKKSSNINLVRYLLEKGADPLWSDKYGRSLQELSENAEIWELMRWARNGEQCLQDARKKLAEKDFVSARILLDQVKPEWKAAGLLERLTLIQPVEREVDGELVEWSKRRVALALDLKNDFFKTHLQEEDGMKCHRIAQDLQKILNDMIKANSKQAEDLGAKYLLSLCTTREDNYGEVLASCLEIDSAVQDLQIIVKARDEGETIVAKCYKELAEVQALEVENKKRGIQMDPSHVFQETISRIANVWRQGREAMERFIAARSPSSLDCLLHFFVDVMKYEQLCMIRFRASGDVEVGHSGHMNEAEDMIEQFDICFSSLSESRAFGSDQSSSARFEQSVIRHKNSVKVARTAEKKRQSLLAFEQAGMLLNKEYFEEAREKAARAAAIMNEIGETVQERIIREFLDHINNNEDTLRHRKIMIRVQADMETIDNLLSQRTVCSGQEAITICSQLLTEMFDDVRTWTSKRVLLTLPFHDVYVRLSVAHFLCYDWDSANKSATDAICLDPSSQRAKSLQLISLVAMRDFQRASHVCNAATISSTGEEHVPTQTAIERKMQICKLLLASEIS